VHLSDDSLTCGSLLANQLEGENLLDDELPVIDIDGDSEGSWEEVPAGLFFFFSCLVDFHAIKVSPDEFQFNPFEEQVDNISYNFTPPAPLPPKQYVNEFLPSLDGITRHKEYHPNRAHFSSGGENLLQRMDQDLLSKHRETNVHYPFADRTEWELAQWLNSTSLTQQQIDSFLRLDYVSHPFIDNEKTTSKQNGLGSNASTVIYISS
jgi:hypothetical protein